MRLLLKENAVEPKSIFLSRTFWVNTLTLAATVLGSLTGLLPPEAAPWITGTLSVVNVVLRFLTDKPVTV